MPVTESRRRHWDTVYSDKSFADVSWYQERPGVSLEFIERSGIDTDDAIVDVGGGASTLVDYLLGLGYSDLTVLDVSASAFRQARERLGTRADEVAWLTGDVTRFEPERQYRLWHDRAVLHFLTDADDRERYTAALRTALASGGYVILATFGPDGPEKCSGLPVRRYTEEMMAELLGIGFELLHHELDVHETPAGNPQQFLYSIWRRT